MITCHVCTVMRAVLQKKEKDRELPEKDGTIRGHFFNLDISPRRKGIFKDAKKSGLTARSDVHKKFIQPITSREFASQRLSAEVY